MGKILHKLVALIFEKIGRFIIIMIILLGVAWFKAEWAKLQVQKNDEKKIAALLANAKRDYQRIKEEITRNETEWNRKKDALMQPIRIQIEKIDRELSEKAPLLAEKVKELSTAVGQKKMLEDAATAARADYEFAISVLQKHDYIQGFSLGERRCR